MVGVVGWAVVIGLVLAWEGLSLAVNARGWPTSSDMLRAATRSVLSRWVLFAAWLWLGWHVFMRGWVFFLRGNGAATPPRAPRSGLHLLTQVVLPLAACYIGAVLVTVTARRDALAGRAGGSGERTRGLGRAVRQAVLTVTGGYIVFVVAIALYATVAGNFDTGLVRGAFWQGAFLAFAIALPTFLVGCLIQSRRRARHQPTRGSP